MDVGTLLSRLEGVRKTPNGWEALCPAHEDTKPSLSIGTGEDGRILVHCQTRGCPPEAVVGKLGLKLSDLMPSDNGNGDGKPRIVATYDYRDAAGELVFQVVRFQPKDFRQRRPDGNEGWVWNLQGVVRVPYRLPELLAADPGIVVWIAEGEKDADKLAAVGLVATCNAGGAGKWRADYATHFAGRHVVVLPDNDPPGKAHAEKVAASLSGVAASVRVLELPGLPDKGDASDWLDNGGTALDLGRLAAEATEWVPTAPQEGAHRARCAQDSDEAGGKADADKRMRSGGKNHPSENFHTGRTTDQLGDALFPAVTAAQLATADYSVTWLIAGHLVADQPAFIGGGMKTCKTLVAIDAAISLATATPFLGAFEVPDPVPVAFMSGEGGLSVLQDYARRVSDSHGRDLADIGAMLMFCDRLPMLQDLEHVSALEAFLKHWEIRVVFLDPLELCMSGDDAGNLMKQGRLLRYVNQVCIRVGCTPVLLHHTKRNIADPYAPPELADLSWAGFGEFAGQWWLLGRREKYSGDTPGEHRLWLNVGGRSGHTALHALDVHEGALSGPGGRFWSVRV